MSSKKLTRVGISASANSGCAASNAGRSERIRGKEVKLCLGGGQLVAHSKLMPQPHGSFSLTNGANLHVL